MNVDNDGLRTGRAVFRSLFTSLGRRVSRQELVESLNLGCELSDLSSEISGAVRVVVGCTGLGLRYARIVQSVENARRNPGREELWGLRKVGRIKHFPNAYDQIVMTDPLIFFNGFSEERTKGSLELALDEGIGAGLFVMTAAESNMILLDG